MFSDKVKTWKQDSSGNIVMLFALIMVPLLLVAAFAVDAARQIGTDRHLQSAIDAASLAGARAMEDSSVTDGEIEAIALES